MMMISFLARPVGRRRPWRTRNAVGAAALSRAWLLFYSSARTGVGAVCVAAEGAEADRALLRGKRNAASRVDTKPRMAMLRNATWLAEACTFRIATWSLPAAASAD